MGNVVAELNSKGITVEVCDPVADAEIVKRGLGISLTALDNLQPADAVIFGVPHALFVESGWPLVTKLLCNGQGFVADIKGVLERSLIPPGVELWRL